MYEARVTTKRRPVTAVLVAGSLLLAVLSAIAFAPSARAAPCDAYGCSSSTTTPPAFDPHCSVSSTSAASGTMITATVTNAAPSSSVQLTFDGSPVGAAATTGAEGSAVLSFAVPQGTASATHSLFAVLASTSINCAPNGFAILGSDLSRGGTGGGSLARTGIEIALFLAVALVLLVVGATLVRTAQRRRRRLARQRNRARELTRL